MDYLYLCLISSCCVDSHYSYMWLVSCSVVSVIPLAENCAREVISRVCSTLGIVSTVVVEGCCCIEVTVLFSDVRAGISDVLGIRARMLPSDIRDRMVFVWPAVVRSRLELTSLCSGARESTPDWLTRLSMAAVEAAVSEESSTSRVSWSPAVDTVAEGRLSDMVDWWVGELVRPDKPDWMTGEPVAVCQDGVGSWAFNFLIVFLRACRLLQNQTRITSRS